MLYVFQQILCYWAWLKQDNYWMVDDMEACHQATASIKIMMRQLQALWPRHDGMEWNLTKLHEQFHVPLDILRHGAHRNVHTGPQEHNHLDIKFAAKRTQLNKKLLDVQTAERLTERLIIQRAFDRVMHDSVVNHNTCNFEMPGPFARASKGILHFNGKSIRGRLEADGEFIFKNPKYALHCPLLHDDILAFLGSRLLPTFGTHPNNNPDDQTTTLDVPFFTEYQRNGFVYRTHPYYRSKHAYYDWAYIQWWDGDDPLTGEPKHVSIIGRILLFFTHPDGSNMAVVHSVDWDRQEQHGVYFELSQKSSY